MSDIMSPTQDSPSRSGQPDASTVGGQLCLRILRNIKDDYDIVNELGQGGQSRVYHALDKRTGSSVALKVVKHAESASKEIRFLSTLRHPCIVQLRDAFICGDHIHIAVEMMNTDAHILATKTQLAHTNSAVAFLILHSVVMAVKYLHDRGVCHRDIKLENVLLDGDGAKLCDFGLAEEVPDGIIRTGGRGSLNYAAPEVLRGQAYQGTPADMWSIGVLAFTLLIGYMPFISRDRAELKSRIAKGEYSFPGNARQQVRDFISALLTVDPAQRMTIDQLIQHPFWISVSRHLRIRADKPFLGRSVPSPQKTTDRKARPMPKQHTVCA